MWAQQLPTHGKATERPLQVTFDLRMSQNFARLWPPSKTYARNYFVTTWLSKFRLRVTARFLLSDTSISRSPRWWHSFSKDWKIECDMVGNMFWPPLDIYRSNEMDAVGPSRILSVTISRDELAKLGKKSFATFFCDGFISFESQWSAIFSNQGSTAMYIDTNPIQTRRPIFFLNSICFLLSNR